MKKMEKYQYKMNKLLNKELFDPNILDYNLYITGSNFNKLINRTYPTYTKNFIDDLLFHSNNLGPLKLRKFLFENKPHNQSIEDYLLELNNDEILVKTILSSYYFLTNKYYDFCVELTDSKIWLFFNSKHIIKDDVINPYHSFKLKLINYKNDIPDFIHIIKIEG